MTPQEEITAIRNDLAAKGEGEVRLKRAIVTLEAAGLSPEAQQMLVGMRIALRENQRFIEAGLAKIRSIKADNCWGSSEPGYYL
jgi:hypothetical protein